MGHDDEKKIGEKDIAQPNVQNWLVRWGDFTHLPQAKQEEVATSVGIFMDRLRADEAIQFAAFISENKPRTPVSLKIVVFLTNPQSFTPPHHRVLDQAREELDRTSAFGLIKVVSHSMRHQETAKTQQRYRDYWINSRSQTMLGNFYPLKSVSRP